MIKQDLKNPNPKWSVEDHKSPTLDKQINELLEICIFAIKGSEQEDSCITLSICWPFGFRLHHLVMRRLQRVPGNTDMLVDPLIVHFVYSRGTPQMLVGSSYFCISLSLLF